MVEDYVLFNLLNFPKSYSFIKTSSRGSNYFETQWEIDRQSLLERSRDAQITDILVNSVEWAFRFREGLVDDLGYYKYRMGLQSVHGLGVFVLFLEKFLMEQALSVVVLDIHAILMNLRDNSAKAQGSLAIINKIFRKPFYEKSVKELEEGDPGRDMPCFPVDLSLLFDMLKLYLSSNGFN